MKSIRFLFEKINQYDRAMLLIMAIYTILSGIYPFIWVLVPSLIIKNASLWSTTQISMVIMVVGLLAMICGFMTSFLKGNYRMRMNNVRYYLIRDLMASSLTMPYEETLHPDTLDRINFANESVQNPATGAGGIILTLLQLFGEIFAVVGFVGVLSTLSHWIMLIIFALIVFTFLLSEKTAQAEENFWDEASPSMRQTETMMDVARDPIRKKDILLYDTYGVLQQYIHGFSTSVTQLYKAVLSRTFNAETGIALLNLIRDAVLYSWLIYKFVNHQMDTSSFYLYSAGLTSFIAVAQQCMKDLSLIRKESKRFLCYIELTGNSKQPIQQEVSLTSSGTVSKMDLQKGVEVQFSDVSFRYPNAEQDTISHLNLTISAGEKLAIVGENGAGKSTLIKLLCRLYAPTSGEITMNGINIWHIPENQYRKELSVVFQDAMVLPFSIKENISMSKTTDLERFKSAVNESGFHQVMDKLEQKENSILLRILDDDGIDLSGGQRQKLFLARALYKENSQFLILDEPTAALDPLAERTLYEKYSEMTKGKSSLFISHRLASTRFCNHIAFLEHGKITEYGTHEELLKLGKRYAEMFEIQAKNYRNNPNTNHTDKEQKEVS